MFTGIIETIGTIHSLRREGKNVHFLVESSLSMELKVDQSIAHNGACLTVTKLVGNGHWVTAIDETLQKTNLGSWTEGSHVNMERCMLVNSRFDGHIVQGHVDQTGVVTSIKEDNGSWTYRIEYDAGIGNITVEKGSITINGVSLTCFDVNDTSFSVAIIPYTYHHTTFSMMAVGDRVNLEFDIVGKYIKRLIKGSSIS